MRVDFKKQKQIPEQTLLQLIFNLPGLQITTCGRVIRVREMLSDDRKQWRLGITFIDLKHSDKKQIGSWLYKQQQKMLKKGLPIPF